MSLEKKIVQYVAAARRGVSAADIARALGESSSTDLAAVLANLTDAGSLRLYKKRYSADAPTLPKVGVLTVKGVDSNGDLYAEPDNWDVEKSGPRPAVLVLPDRNQNKSKKRRTPKSPARAPGIGDSLLARLRPVVNEQYGFEARIIKVLGRQKTEMLGLVTNTSKGWRIVPTDKRARHEYALKFSDNKGLKNGQLVKFQPVRSRQLGLRQAEILKVLGSVSDFANISHIALAEHGIKTEFPDEVMAEARALKPFAPKASPDHEDLRHLPFITIDPADARDHDDAVWAEQDTSGDNPGGVHIHVAIADVAWYVRPQSPLDREARERGNSTYLPDQVVPMLPERLSNDLCSLKAGKDRPALVCHMTFDKSGRKRSHRFSRALICSHAGLSYEQAQAIIDGNIAEKDKEIADHSVKPLWNAYQILLKGRKKRAPLELELPEQKLLLGKDGLVTDVITPPVLTTHKIIEECMIQANVCAAETLEAAKQAFIYRVHDAPSDEKLQALAEFLRGLGLSAPVGQVMKPSNFNQILKKAAKTEHAEAINQIVLRTQAQAEYSTDNLGHFGLNLRRYAHFTSPIRRYADLTVHRSLISVCGLGQGGLGKAESAHFAHTAAEISLCERRSISAERDTRDRMIAKFLSGRVGKQFVGRIAGIAGAGLFVRLDELGADGFVPVSSLEGDYFAHIEDKHELVGTNTGETFRVGDTVRVALIEAAPVSGGLRFELLSRGRKGKPLDRRSARKHRGKRKRRK